MTHKGEKYSVKLQKYYFCNGTRKRIQSQSYFTELSVHCRFLLITYGFTYFFEFFATEPFPMIRNSLIFPNSRLREAVMSYGIGPFNNLAFEDNSLVFNTTVTFSFLVSIILASISFDCPIESLKISSPEIYSATKGRHTEKKKVKDATSQIIFTK